MTSIEIGDDDSGHTTNAMRCNPAAGESSDCWLPFCQHEVGRLGALNTNSGRDAGGLLQSDLYNN